jgi:hypothetical protein
MAAPKLSEARRSTPQGTFLAACGASAVHLQLTSDELRARLVSAATDGATESAHGWGSHDLRWLTMTAWCQQVVAGTRQLVHIDTGGGRWAVIDPDTGAVAS